LKSDTPNQRSIEKLGLSETHTQPKRALITGITGQDGSYLAEFLLGKGYEVHGIIRRSSSLNTGRIDHLYSEANTSDTSLFLHYGDLSDASRLVSLVHTLRPDEIYNLGAQSHVQVSFNMPEYTSDIVALGALRLLEIVRGADWPIRFYQAGSSEMFGKALETPQRETTPFNPQSPYATAKTFAHFLTTQYRDAYGLYACNGILFNHESPRRGANFVTRKVTRGVASIIADQSRDLHLGNLDAYRDWGYAPEYVEAMWLMLQQDQPDDYVIGTGEMNSVRELVELAFSLVGLEWQRFVRCDERYLRPAEVNLLLSDASKARRVLGWQPRTTFHDLIRIMLATDLREAGVDLSAFACLSGIPLDVPRIAVLEAIV
jgi:GDPmannose 4,6-dehydratase